jgi:hypothetical protein
MRPLALFALTLLLAGCAALGGQRLQAQDLGLVLTAPQMAPRPQTAQRLRPEIRPGAPARMLVIGISLAQGFGLLLDQRAQAAA